MKSIMITGASRGIGRAIALELAKTGQHVFYCIYHKNKNAMAEVQRELIEKYKCVCFVTAANIAVRDDVNKAIDYFKSVDTGFGVDILINNAGKLRNRTLKKMSWDEWHDCINVNLHGVFNVTQSILPYMHKYGCIINITSISGITGNFGQTNYSAAKAGVIGFTKSLAKELGKDYIRVNAVAVGLCETDIINDIPIAVVADFIGKIPFKRLSEPAEVAKLVRFITMEDTYSNGAVFDITGGLI